MLKIGDWVTQYSKGYWQIIDIKPKYAEEDYQYENGFFQKKGDLIGSWVLMKKGFIIVPELKPENESHTIVVNYAETGRRNLNLGYAIEITIQILSATDNSLLCTGTAEGQGSTEADDIRIAINRCLAEIFK